MPVDPSVLKLAEILAWPVLAFVGLIILGPGGLLERLFQIVSTSVVDLNRAVSEFKDTTLKLRTDIDSLNDVSKSLAGDIYDKIESISKSVNDTSNRLDQLLVKADKTLESSAALLQVTVAGDTALTDSEEQPESPQTSQIPLDTEQRYGLIKSHWENLVQALRGKFNNPSDFDARRVGEMARKLSHKNRKDALDDDLAAEIAELHSQFKKIVRLRSTKDQWLTQNFYNEFITSVENVRLVLGRASKSAVRATKVETTTAPA